jgi:hypothetical protein
VIATIREASTKHQSVSAHCLSFLHDEHITGRRRNVCRATTATPNYVSSTLYVCLPATEVLHFFIFTANHIITLPLFTENG